MSERSDLVAYLPSHQISVYQGEDGLAVDFPDTVDSGLAEEAANFVADLLESDPDGLERIRAAGAWVKLDRAFVKWCLKRALR